MPVPSGDCCITGHWQNKPYPYAPYQGLTLGDGILRSLDMENEYWWVWLGIGVNLAYIFLMNVIIIICLAYLPGESCFLCGQILLATPNASHQHTKQLMCTQQIFDVAMCVENLRGCVQPVVVVIAPCFELMDSKQKEPFGRECISDAIVCIS